MARDGGGGGGGGGLLLFDIGSTRRSFPANEAVHIETSTSLKAAGLFPTAQVFVTAAAARASS